MNVITMVGRRTSVARLHPAGRADRGNNPERVGQVCGELGLFEFGADQARMLNRLGNVAAYDPFAIIAVVDDRAGYKQGKTKALRHHAPHHLDRGRPQYDIGSQAQVLKQADEVRTAGLYIQ